jgi:CHRD domain
MRRAGFVALVFGAAVLAVAPALAATNNYHANLVAEEEVPTKGPAGAKGTADFVLDSTAGTVCYTLTYTGIAKPTAAHIHQGPKGVAGPIVVDLNIAQNGDKGCVPADKAKMDAINGGPAGYYANIHTADYPKGAMRGQLATSK